MTLDKEFQEVTHWHPVQHKETLLLNRIDKGQVESLKAYLTPL